MTALALLPALWLACAGDPAAPATCAERPAGLDRDACRFDRVQALPPEALPALQAEVQAIEDPVVRTAAVDRWIRDHGADLPPAEGRALCRLLPPAEAAACDRRLSSAHLRR